MHSTTETTILLEVEREKRRERFCLVFTHATNMYKDKAVVLKSVAKQSKFTKLTSGLQTSERNKSASS